MGLKISMMIMISGTVTPSPSGYRAAAAALCQTRTPPTSHTLSPPDTFHHKTPFAQCIPIFSAVSMVVVATASATFRLASTREYAFMSLTSVL